MKVKKHFNAFSLITLIFLAITGPSGPARSQGPAGIAEMVTKAEESVLGEEGRGGVLQRIAILETALFGRSSEGSLMKRAENLSRALYTGREDLGPLISIANYTEWQLRETVTSNPLVRRVPEIEKLVLGKQLKGPISTRLRKVIQTAVLGKPLHVQRIILNEGILVKMKTLDAVSSKDCNINDSFRFAVADDIIQDGCLVIPRGLTGTCRVLQARKAQKFGRNGSIAIEFETIQAIDGTDVPLAVNARAIENNKQAGFAAGASLVGMAALGPVGLLGGVLVSGKDVDLPAGTEIFASVREPVEVGSIYLGNLK
ncbi:MAG: hypothetical protein CVV64_00820 [Candidatus Wallbacteria bacterium HGW-Wallbacteria-1]|uniref:Uncharacterized protein n=1 Tax=Candidatus Wallbacteria bacterium HGW-Wallbacteria-1 TaxID=2013854 RepID=A0A2N1PUH0_9BACT|nr:MAG: hypothetical protein CVV64_00820 [Candidatus Wallbacteria bacterium HGW-Wallbacteria-1]